MRKENAKRKMKCREDNGNLIKLELVAGALNPKRHQFGKKVAKKQCRRINLLSWVSHCVFICIYFKQSDKK